MFVEKATKDKVVVVKHEFKQLHDVVHGHSGSFGDGRIGLKLALVTSSASAVGIDVKSDTTSKDTMISCGSIVQLEIFLTKSLLLVTVNWLRCNGDKIEASYMEA